MRNGDFSFDHQNSLPLVDTARARNRNVRRRRYATSQRQPPVLLNSQLRIVRPTSLERCEWRDAQAQETKLPFVLLNPTTAQLLEQQATSQESSRLDLRSNSAKPCLYSGDE